VRLFADPDVPHSLSFVGDVGRALVTVGAHDAALGRARHAPNAPAVSLRAFAAPVREETLLARLVAARAGLVPRPLAALGMIASALILIQGPLQMFGVFQPLSAPVIALSLPVAAFEMILAGWLIVKGFGPSAAASEPARRPALTPVLRPA
jgi:hypothetical protein